MADYDARVRVNTDVNNSDLQKLEQSFNKIEQAADSTNRKIKQQEGSWDSLSAKAEDYKTRLRALEDKGFGFGDKKYDDLYVAWQNAEYAVKKYKDTLNSRTDQGIEQQANGVSKIRDGFVAAEKSSKKCFKSIQEGSKKSNSLLSTMGSRLKGIALSLLVFNWITKGFNAMVNAMKEGFQNLAQYSSEYNESMSALKSQTAQLKNGLAAAFEPIANMILPYLTQLVSWLNTAADAMAQFLAVLQGKSTYTRAKKQVVDYAKSLDTASKSAKGALASFDQLNVLSRSDNSGGAVGGEVVGVEAFETGQVESQITSFAERVKEALQPFSESISNWFQGIDFAPLTDSLSHLKEVCEPFVTYIYNGLLWLLENVLQPLGSWTMEDALPTFIDMLATGMETLDKVLIALRPTFDYIWNNVLVPIGGFTGEVLLWAIDMIKSAFGGLAELFVTHGDKIKVILQAVGRAMELLWIDVGKPTIQFIMGGLRTLLQYIINIVGDVIDVLAGIIEFIAGVFTRDWERAGDGLVDIFKGIVNGIIDIFEGIVNTIIDGMNSLSFEIPDWVPEWAGGGSRFGFDLERLDLPRLADGAVIQGGQPFAAILGDQRFGQTNIETPLATMIEAFKQAQAENGGTGGGSYTFVAQLNGKTIFQETVRQNQMQYKATGKNAFA